VKWRCFRTNLGERLFACSFGASDCPCPLFPFLFLSCPSPLVRLLPRPYPLSLTRSAATIITLEPTELLRVDKEDYEKIFKQAHLAETQEKLALIRSIPFLQVSVFLSISEAWCRGAKPLAPHRV